MDEPASGSDFSVEVGNAIVLAHHDFASRHPFYWNLKEVPGSIRTSDDITTLTITITTPGASVAGTLSAAPAGSISILNYKIRPSGEQWIARVTAHTGGGTAVTLDSVPEAKAAGTATTIYQDEYTLPTDFGYFDHGLWNEDGTFIEVWDLERLVGTYPDPPSPGWPPRAAALIALRKLRFSSYPTSVQRVEFPYIITEADISGSGALTIPQHLRWVLAHGALALCLLMKSDKRAGFYQQQFERGIDMAIAFDRRARMGVGRVPATVERGLYTW